MKDKELRKLLAEQGIIRQSEVLGIYASSSSMNAANLKILKLERKVQDLGASVHINHELAYSASEEVGSTQKDVKVLTRNLAELHAKFDAINKHYGISVEKQEAQYVVKEGE